MNRFQVKNEFDHIYYVIKTTISEKDFIYRMITENKIEGVIPGKERYAENQFCLYYEVTGKKTLDKEYSTRKMEFTDIYELFSNMKETMQRGREYLLDSRYMVFDPQAIFLDMEEPVFSFIYIPFSDADNKEQMKEKEKYAALADFLLEKTDHREEHVVNTAYRFYQMSKEDFFSLEHFMAFLEKERILYEREISRNRERAERPLRTDRPAGSDRYFGMDRTIRPVRTDRPAGSDRYFGMDKSTRATRLDRPIKTDRYVGMNKSESQRLDSGIVGTKEETGEIDYEEQDNEQKKGSTEKGKKIRSMVIIGVMVAISVLLGTSYFVLGISQIYAVFIFVPAVMLLLVAIFLSGRILYEWVKKTQDEEYERNLPVTVEEYWGDAEDIMEEGTVYFKEIEEKTGQSTLWFSWEQNGVEQKQELKTFPAMIGKLQDKVDIYVNDTSVSRIHALVKCSKNMVFLQDLDSTNGTKVNGISLISGEERQIKRNDKIQFGNMTINVV